MHPALALGVILNPRAKRHRDDPSIETDLRRIVGGRGEIFACATLDELDAALEDLVARDLRTLAIAGGDGTTSLVLSRLAKHLGSRPLPAVAMLRAGTMNTVANAVGVPRRSTRALLTRLVASLARGEPLPRVARGTLSVDGRLGFLFGTGAIYGFLDEYYRAGGGAPTPWTAARTLLRGSASALVGGDVVRRITMPCEATITVDGTRWERRQYLTVGLGTIDQIGLGFRPFHLVGERADAMHVLAIHASPASFVAGLPRVRLGRSLGPERVREQLARAVTFSSDGAPLRYMVDGDLLETTQELHVLMGPAVELLT